MIINNSIKNIIFSIIAQLILIILGFVSRKIFVENLGIEYLGINGLLTNVISMLALVESGIGTSIVYFLYKPLAENDRPRIIALIQLYKKAYSVIALIILILSILLYPLLDILIKGNEGVNFLPIIYFLFVLKNVVYYLNAHKFALINADQKGYVLTKINIGYQIFTTFAKIVVLIVTQNFILYLLIELIIFAFQNFFNGRVVTSRYPYINTKQKYNLENEDRYKLIKNIKALSLHNIGGYVTHGTDNLLISSFIGISTVGLFSNYMMIISQLSSLLAPLLNGIGASIGNLIATESNEKKYSIFNVLFLVNFWLYSTSVIFLFNLLEPFINWWLGSGFLLDRLTFIVILANFFISGMRTSIFIFKTKGGIFVQDRYVPLLGAIINLVTSIVLVNKLGLPGIFLGTTISILSVFWYAPVLVYKQIFNKPASIYFKKYIFYILLTIVSAVVTSYIYKKLPIIEGEFSSLLFIGLICLIVPSSIYLLIFHKTNEFRYLASILLNRIKLQIIKRKEFKTGA